VQSCVALKQTQYSSIVTRAIATRTSLSGHLCRRNPKSIGCRIDKCRTFGGTQRVLSFIFIWDDIAPGLHWFRDSRWMTAIMTCHSDHNLHAHHPPLCKSRLYRLLFLNQHGDTYFYTTFQIARFGTGRKARFASHCTIATAQGCV
jgi:hypothetical protein